jgi:hypothetical protein
MHGHVEHTDEFRGRLSPRLRDQPRTLHGIAAFARLERSDARPTVRPANSERNSNRPPSVILPLEHFPLHEEPHEIPVQHPSLHLTLDDAQRPLGGDGLESARR